MTTPSPDADATARVDSDVRYPSHPRGAQPQFAPGTMIAGRYRIAGILGSGGMGEVYRADDIKLDQAVALKFLPARLARDPILLARLHDEVRLGRQISHPNVCRTYDIIDWEGAHFVAMEYVDGEDLSRLLRRIGRLAHDKAVDIARGIAAGLLAAHVKGILHRDLKPANVMIDSHGEARIMDFGLALAAGEDDGTVSGTPAYMAPEQLEGQPATVQSDLYALGLVMYELFTGKRAHAARTLPERVRDLTSEITTPSNVVRDLDPTVERVILRCLSNDSSQRPRSAREIVEALPGGDPLAAALAAGETPSPGMVAAAGIEGSLSRVKAWSLLAVVAAMFTWLLLIRQERTLSNFMPPSRSPQALHDRAEDLLREFGVKPSGAPLGSLQRQTKYYAWLDAAKIGTLRSGPAPFVYRLTHGVTSDQADEMDELTAVPGRPTISVDLRGRLTFLLAAPPREWTERTLDPNAVLRAAGLEPAALKPVPVTFAPPAPFDKYAAWSGTYPGDAVPIRAELASWHGTPTFFRVTGVWDERATPEMAFENRNSGIFVLILFFVLLAASGVLAWRNLRLRRGDRPGAWRMAAALFIVAFATGLLERDLGGDLVQSAFSLFRSGGDALAVAAIFYVLYIAIEPVIRRRWPAQLISWTRLVSGRWRDPMIGRDVVIGVIAGLFHASVATSTTFVLARLLGTPTTPSLEEISMMSGLRRIVAFTLEQMISGVFQGFLFMGLLALLTILLRKRAFAAGGLLLINAVGVFVAAAGQMQIAPFLLVLIAVLTWVAVRFGLLAYAVTQTVFGLLFFVTPMGASWANPLVAIPYGVAILLALWGFYTSLGGQSPFSASLLDE